MTTRETTRERETRQRAEDYAALRAEITPEMRVQAASDATRQLDGEKVGYEAGERHRRPAGNRRSIDFDAGEVRRLALADALKAAGADVIAHGTTFGLFAGRSSVRYTVTIATPR